MPPSDLHFLDLQRAQSHLGDSVVLRDMLDLLQQSLAQDLAEIDQLLQQGQVAAANRLLHALKGFAPVFCSESLCAEVVAVEALSKHSEAPAVVLAYDQLRPRLEGLRQEVRQYLAYAA